MATIQQEKYYNNIICNTGNKTRVQMALEAGYSPSTAEAPGRNIESKPAFQALLNERLPDKKLLATHEKLLDSPEENTVIRVLDMAYKLKGAYAAEKHLNVNVDHKSVLDELEDDRQQTQR